MRIVIVGAGIGGLATALSLHAAGFRDVVLHERVDELRALGVGINVLPHAIRELAELGLADEIAALGVLPSTLSYWNRFGQPIWSEPRGREAGYLWPQVSIHRGELQLALVRAVRERLGADAIRLRHALLRIEHGADADTAVFATAAGEVSVGADVIVAADGIHSAFRRQAYPLEGRPVWNGLTLWRGTARVPTFLDGRSMIMAGDGEQKFVAYPLRARDGAGLAVVNFIAERRGVGDETVDWNHAVDPVPIVEMFRDWRFDWLDVPGVIGAADEILEYPMVDRDPIPQWTFGRTTLLGDAAHAMYPNGSNGASQAILDARTLAFHLATAADAPAALAAYEDARRPATTALVLSNRQQGPERVMLLARERAPEGFDAIEDVIPEAELTEIAAGYKRAAGFLPEILNARPSLTPPAR
ncbi:flavin-dependent oxidoreductase [Microbacterium sp. SS28]|uniref:flavin-dependent oxidoreductase n=1 Tax=Microbacterium sp. SS28 TaxID=2919948 RepID=UPI001FAA4C73|nr:flavin-dependent oxidoreductase [Microbacterium sp. SS28]